MKNTRAHVGTEEERVLLIVGMNWRILDVVKHGVHPHILGPKRAGREIGVVIIIFVKIG